MNAIDNVGRCSLILCILRPELTPSQAINYIERGTIPCEFEEKSVDAAIMLRLRRRLSYQKIGMLFDLSTSAVFNRLKKHKMSVQHA